MTQHFLEDDDYQGRLDLTLWRRIAGHARPYARQLVGLGGAGAVLAGIDVLFPLVTGRLIDEAVDTGLTSRLLVWGGGYAALVVGLVLCVWVFIVLAGQTATGVAYDLRRKGFARLQELSFSYYDVRPVGWLVTRLTSDCHKLSSLIPWFALDIVWGTCLITGVIGAMLLLNWQLGLVVTAIMPPLVIVSIFFQKRLLASSRGMRRTNSQLTASFNECIMGVRTTKTLVREADNLDEFKVGSTTMYEHSMRNALQSAVYLPMVIVLGSAGVGLCLWRGGAFMSGGVMAGGVVSGGVGGGLTIGTLVAFMQYCAFLYMPIQELARRFTELQSAQAAAERVQELLDTEPEIRDTPEVECAIVAQAERAPASGIAVDGGAQRIEEITFKDVSFWYKEGEPVLESFDLTVEAGQTVALIGATGGGKSTIVNLVARFYEPSSGRILINGIDYRERSLHWLQSNLGVVQQAPHLFSGSVRENIRYGRLDATNEEIVAAARATGAHEFISGIEAGYDADVGEGGSALSTGERQLLSLARAVLADPQIFIMDEATSSVDTETERLIQRGVEAVLHGRIAFVIAHRLSTIRNADVILVIDGGRIVERGTHAELIGSQGRYHALYTQQFVSQKEAELFAPGG